MMVKPAGSLARARGEGGAPCFQNECPKIWHLPSGGKGRRVEGKGEEERGSLRVMGMREKAWPAALVPEL